MIFRHLPSALRFALTPKHGKNYRQWLNTPAGRQAQDVESIIIPCYGLSYVEEAKLSAWFAQNSLPSVKEVVIVSDQAASAFGPLPDKVRVSMVDIGHTPRPAYDAIWHSRLLKINAPLQAKGKVIAMIDSDLMVLRDFSVIAPPHTLLGTFRTGRMSAKIKNLVQEQQHLKGTRRPYLETHINGGFLVADRETWENLCPTWTEIFLAMWSTVSDRPPTDQLPLAVALDRLQMMTGDLGILLNWPVSKQIGGKSAPIPRDVIGAHGGFPLSEYEKLKHDRDASLSFRDQHYTRKARYQNK